MQSQTEIALPGCEVLAEYPIDETVWHQLRAEGIGGSDAGIIMGANRYETPLSLWMLKTGRSEPREGSEATEMGSLLEPFIRRELVEPYLLEHEWADGIRIIEPAAMYRSLTHEWMLANTDGFIELDGTLCGLEIKTGNSYQLQHWKDGRVPETYWWQVQHYMAVTGLTTWIVFGVIGNRRIVRRIEADEAAIEELTEHEKNFWALVERNDPLWAPIATGHDRDMDALMELGSPQTEDTADLEPVELSLRRYIDLGEQLKDVKEQRERAKQLVLQQMGNARYGQVGNLQVTFSRYTVARLDAKRLKAERPEIAAEYTKETETGRLSVKEIE